MADNVTAPGAGAVLAFDEVVIGGITVQVGRNKVGYGPDGTYTEMAVQPSTEATLALIKTGVDLLHSDNTAGGSLPAGTAIIGKVGVDLTGTGGGTSGNPLFVSTTATAVATWTNVPTTTVVGATATGIVANTSRKALRLQNNTASDMRVSEVGTASATVGILLPASKNALYEWPASAVPTTAISVWCATAGLILDGWQA